MKPALILAGAALFIVLATANAGGYRYGVSDQAFYAAAVLKARTPTLFPRDSSLLASESSFMSTDKILASLSRLGHLDLPSLFLVVQVVTLVTLFGAGAAFCRALGLSWWATTLFLAFLTLRHHITKTGANTLEGYMHPRVLAFALGLGAMAAILRRRPWVASLSLLAAALAHPTTALWYGLVAAPATAIDRPQWRPWILGASALVALTLTWALMAGPLAGRLQPMDQAWLAVLADRDYLFPSRWPAYAWIINLAYLALILSVWRARRRRGVALDAETGLIVGWITLVVVFLGSVPFEAFHVALAVQAQVDRVFWLLDVAATAYLAWWILSGPLGSTARRRTLVVFVALLLAAARGGYVLRHADGRRLVQVGLPDTPWTETMNWIRQQPPSWNVLADPGHAWEYGVSVRVAAARDTVLDESKDPAVAMYDRTIARRVADRERALADFGSFTTTDMKRVGREFAADVVVVPRTQRLDLPILHANGAFVVYDLR